MDDPTPPETFPEASREQKQFLLECTAGSRKRTSGGTAYGFALLRQPRGDLVATGSGVVHEGVTLPQAVHQAAAYGLQAAVQAGATEVVVHTDSTIALKFLRAWNEPHSRLLMADVWVPAAAGDELLLGAAGQGVSPGTPLSITDMGAALGSLRFELVERRSNGLALIQAELALELLRLLLQVPHTPPSKYHALSDQLGALLQLPLSARRQLEGAADFEAAVAELVALRCGTDEQSVLAAMHSSLDEPANATQGADNSSNGSSSNDSSPSISSSSSSGDADGSSSSSSSSPRLPAAVRQAQHRAATAAAAAAAAAGRPRALMHMSRSFSAEEGARFAKAAAEAAAKTASAQTPHAAGPLQPQQGSETHMDQGDGSSGSKSSSSKRGWKGGRVFGRHRVDQRQLLVGLHPLPPPWQDAPPLHQQQQQQDSQQPPQQQQDQQQQHQQQEDSGLDVAAIAQDTLRRQEAFSRHGTAWRGGLGGVSTQIDDFLLSSWLPKKQLTTQDSLGLAASRYRFPPVNSDRATHLLQFDGASRNNPGRAGYGFVLYDLSTTRLVLRGCMSLPYGYTVASAEYEGLLAGLQAAHDAGVRHLAVQGDSSTVLDAFLLKKSINIRYLAQFFKRAQLAMLGFEHVDMQFIPREQNLLADRLASMSMDIDTGLYAVIRRGDQGVDSLRIITRAARFGKSTAQLEPLLELYPLPLVLVVLLNRVMGITVDQLLARLQAKAASMGDPNPWLVQEVAKLARSGVSEAQMSEVASVLMDSRFDRTHSHSLKQHMGHTQQQLREQGTALPGAVQAPLVAGGAAGQQVQQHRSYSSSPAGAAADWSAYAVNFNRAQARSAGMASSIGSSSSSSGSSSASSSGSSSRSSSVFAPLPYQQQSIDGLVSHPQLRCAHMTCNKLPLPLPQQQQQRQQWKRLKASSTAMAETSQRAVMTDTLCGTGCNSSKRSLRDQGPVSHSQQLSGDTLPQPPVASSAVGLLWSAAQQCLRRSHPWLHAAAKLLR